MQGTSLAGTIAVAVIAACGGSAEPEKPAEPVPEKCRNVHIDKMAADWVAVKGASADPKHRIRIQPGQGGVDYLGWYVNQGFAHRVLHGEKRDGDVKFTEVADEARRKQVESGAARLVRLYLEPKIEQCSLKGFVGSVGAGDKEQIEARQTEFVAFPAQEGVTFSYNPADGPLFLGEAARDRKVADKQLAGEGPAILHEMGTVPVGVFTAVGDDGDEGCTYDMDLYFDDLMLAELSPKPAGPVQDGFRHWFHVWEAPYSGNHHFEFYRYRTCEGGERTLIGVSGIDAILQS